MTKKILFLILMIFFLFFGFGSVYPQDQEKMELFGYFESQYMVTSIKDHTYQFFTNKLRIDLKSSLSENVSFAANFDLITYHGKKEWDILDFLASRITSQIPESMKNLYVIPFSDEIFLDNAFMRLSFKPFDLTVGKQQISLGTGYVWNPLDIFNIKDILDPTYEQPGHNAVRIDIPLGLTSTVSGLYSPGNEWKDSAKLLRLKTRIFHFDFSLVAIAKEWRFHDYTRFDDEAMDFAVIPQKRNVLGASTAGEIFGLGLWSEFAYNWMGKTENFYELVVGTDYTFDFQTHILVEYYRTTLGKSDDLDYTLTDWMRLFAQEQKAVSQDQVYISFQHPATDLLTVGLSSIASLSDGSIALVPTFIYSFSDNVDVFAYLNFNLGKEGKAFARITGNGGFLRVRVYF